VRGFFRNGGRRCFVVRVAGEGAQATGFQLPGLVVRGRDRFRHARLAARSAGSWADGLRVAASIAASALVIRPVSVASGRFDLIAPASASVAAGDLIQLALGDGWTLQFVVAQAGAPQRSAQTQAADGERVTLLELTAGDRLWIRALAALPVNPGNAHWIGPTGARRSAPASVAGDGRLSVRTGAEPGPEPGSLVRLRDGVWMNVTGSERAGDAVVLAGDALQLRSAKPAGVDVPRARVAAQRLELELWAGSGTGTPEHRLAGLGLAPGHPRFAGELPTDEILYRDAPERWAEVLDPRFPLAGTGAPQAAFFPIAASLLPEAWLPALPSGRSARSRDGLTDFDARVFLDRRLEAPRTAALLAQATHLLYGTSDPHPEPLRGLHALLALDEVTLIAVPDAAQAGWAPETLEPPRASAALRPLDVPERPLFEDCTPSALQPPALAVEGGPDLRLVWDEPPAGAEVTIEEAADAAFLTSTVIHRGRGQALALGERPAGAHWYRARFSAGELVGPDAIVGPVGAAGAPRALLRRPEDFTDGVLLSVHRALVRLCAARGDMLALLSLPEHYREDAALGHAAALVVDRTGTRTSVPPLGAGEAPALSYAALYHPWLVTTSEDRPGELHRVPPDGALAGVMARRALERGAWVAPANVELPDAVALSRASEPGRRLELLLAQVNVVERSPRGFMALSADTLSTDPELRPLNVRRLLQLLRRLALREGQAYAFEPNGEALRQSVRAGFETVLGTLFKLGAFAGVHPEDGFRVTAAAGADGQLVVELRVAPSRPLVFLTIRLVRSGDGRLVVKTR
jgi:hypothetical protein